MLPTFLLEYSEPGYTVMMLILIINIMEPAFTSQIRHGYILNSVVAVSQCITLLNNSFVLPYKDGMSFDEKEVLEWIYLYEAWINQFMMSLIEEEEQIGKFMDEWLVACSLCIAGSMYTTENPSNWPRFRCFTLLYFTTLRLRKSDENCFVRLPENLLNASSTVWRHYLHDWEALNVDLMKVIYNEKHINLDAKTGG